MDRRARLSASCALASFCAWLVSPSAAAQDSALAPQMNMPMPADTGWQYMQNGIVFAEYNRQGEPRGGDEFVAPNWWTGMVSRNTSRAAELHWSVREHLADGTIVDWSDNPGAQRKGSVTKIEVRSNR